MVGEVLKENEELQATVRGLRTNVAFLTRNYDKVLSMLHHVQDSLLASGNRELINLWQGYIAREPLEDLPPGYEFP